jgi:uncharacterized metal-binding protein YceD (DUF177 family)
MPIKLRLVDFNDDRLDKTFKVSAAELGLNTEHDPMRVDGPILVDVKARLTSEEDVLVQAVIRWRCVQECGLCLDEIAANRVDDFTMLFSPENKRQPQEAACEAESPDLGYYAGEEIDLDDEIAGFMLQEVEEYPRCRPDCRGLDPVTGENLNHVSGEKANAVKKAAQGVPDWKRKLKEIGGGE